MAIHSPDERDEAARVPEAVDLPSTLEEIIESGLATIYNDDLRDAASRLRVSVQSLTFLSDRVDKLEERLRDAREHLYRPTSALQDAQCAERITEALGDTWDPDASSKAEGK